MKEFDEIENLFSSAFDGAEMSPPPNVKEAVDASLFNNPKGGGFFWGYSILLIAFISGGFIAYHATHLDLETSSENITALSEKTALDRTHGSNKRVAANSVINEVNPNEINKEEELNIGYSAAKSANADGLEVSSSGRKENTSKIKNQNNLKSKVDSKSKEFEKVFIDSKNINENLSSSNSGFNRNNVDSNDGIDLSNALESISASGKISEEKSPQKNLNLSFYNSAIADEYVKSSNINEKEKAGSEEVSQLNNLQNSSFILFPLDDRDTLLHHDQGGPLIFKVPNIWSLMLYAGGQGAFNTVQAKSTNSTYRVQEFGGIDLALETDYIISRRLSLGGGIDFTQRKTKLRDSYSMTDSVISGGQWVITNPSQPDTLQDSTFFATYDVTTTQSVYESLTRQTSIGIPVYVSYTIPLNSRLNFRVSAGARVSYESYKVSYEDAGIPATTLSQFGVNAMLRPEVIYNFNRFGVGVYGKMTYDFKHGINWDAINRKRYGLGGGVVLRFKL